MNGCAAFIATSLTLGYLQQSPFLTLTQLILILILSVVSAIGNAGVPMGCYFLSTALLSQLGLDLKLIGLILPIYSLIDMLETSLNVWSDSVITTIIDKKIREQKKVEALY
jgi:Na+/H+-dicarboxylate symporter